MTGIMCTTMGAGYGSGATTVVITTGQYSSGALYFYGLGHTPYDPADYGSASPTTVSTFNSATLESCNYQLNTYYGSEYIYLNLSGDQTSAIWTKMKIGNYTYHKGGSFVPSGTYNSGNNYTSWIWDASINGNPFAYPGTTDVVFS